MWRAYITVPFPKLGWTLHIRLKDGVWPPSSCKRRLGFVDFHKMLQLDHRSAFANLQASLNIPWFSEEMRRCILWSIYLLEVLLFFWSFQRSFGGGISAAQQQPPGLQRLLQQLLLQLWLSALTRDLAVVGVRFNSTHLLRLHLSSLWSL